MENEALEEIERQLTGLHPSAAPGALRAAVLAGVQRELRGARWDRRLARAAAVLLVLGVVLNVSIGVYSMNSRDTSQLQRGSRGNRCGPATGDTARDSEPTQRITQ
jgi:hypothetical protein